VNVLPVTVTGLPGVLGGGLITGSTGDPIIGAVVGGTRPMLGL
jgi:hypothetical protein